MKHTNSMCHGHQSWQHGTIPSSTFNFSVNDKPYPSQIEYPRLGYIVCQTWDRVTTTIRYKEVGNPVSSHDSPRVQVAIHMPHLGATDEYKKIRGFATAINHRSGHIPTTGPLGWYGNVKQVILPHHIMIIKVHLETSSGIPFYLSFGSTHFTVYLSPH
jgi:hypothetical protein